MLLLDMNTSLGGLGRQTRAPAIIVASCMFFSRVYTYVVKSMKNHKYQNKNKMNRAKKIGWLNAKGLSCLPP